MSIWCAIILSVGLVIASVVIAVGKALEGLFSNQQSLIWMFDDEDWEKVESRTTNLGTGIAKKMVGNMFKD